MLRKTLCGLAVAALLSGTPALADDTPQIDIPTTEFTLPNGLHVILHEDHTVPFVHTNIWYFVGSANEKQGRTGFAHLFEHLMFEGSGHVKEGQFDNELENIGGSNNASTSKDRTNYYTSVPSCALEVPLFLESDRMGYLLDSMSTNIVDAQRDVVKNEMRQSYLNRPYGKVWITLPGLMYPEGHPYHWPVIGSMDDLSAAGFEDVTSFFKNYYLPNNASLVIAGDIDTAKTKALVEKWFSDIKPGASVPKVQAPTPVLNGVVKKTLVDNIELPLRLIAWHTPGVFQKDDAELEVLSYILGTGKSSRLYKRLVYDLKIAQMVTAFNADARLSSMFNVQFLPKPGHTLDEVQAVVDEEIARMQNEPPTQKEVEQAVNMLESAYYHFLEVCADKADMMNRYYACTGTPNYFAQDLARYKQVTPSRVQEVAKKYLLKDKRVELTVISSKDPAAKSIENKEAAKK